MNKLELRREQRVSVSRPGTLRLGETAAACQIQNMCSRGFLIRFDKDLPVGRVLQLSCELYPGRSVECKVQVRHVNAECLGAKVMEMSDDDLILCSEFLEEQRAAKLNGSGPGRGAG